VSRLILLDAFGDPGHAFPVIALGRELARRGHDVTLQTWRRWQEDVEHEGMRFAAAPEYHVFPTRERPLTPYQAVERATRETVALVRSVAPDVVVSDILTLAPALAGELEGVPVGTVIPHLDPRMPPGSAPYSYGARLPRTSVSQALWRGADPLLRHGAGDRPQPAQRDAAAARTARARARPRRHQRAARARHDVPAARVSARLADRHARRGPAHMGAAGARRRAAAGRRPARADRSVDGSQDPRQTLLRAALEGLATLPVRVLASTNRHLPPVAVPANARIVDWVSYGRAGDATLRPRRLPRGHGTVARALASGCALAIVPAAGDMAQCSGRCQQPQGSVY